MMYPNCSEEPNAARIASFLVREGWTVRGVEVEHGTYGCETGCGYTRLYAVLDDGAKAELGGSFSMHNVEAEGRALAEKLSVPVTVEGLLDW